MANQRDAEVRLIRHRKLLINDAQRSQAYDKCGIAHARQGQDERAMADIAPGGTLRLTPVGETLRVQEAMI